MSESSEIYCGASASQDGTLGREGGVYLDLEINFQVTHLNASFCAATQRGAAMFFNSMNSLGDVTASWLTCIGNSGYSVIETTRNGSFGITFANFVNNSVTPGWSLLYATTYGMTLTSCVFIGNTNSLVIYEIYLAKDSPDAYQRPYVLIGCVFDSQLILNSQWTVQGAIRTRSTTQTFLVRPQGTHYCPTGNLPSTETFSVWQWPRPVHRKFVAISVFLYALGFRLG
jgi:hypothetical protein